jgi:hypothetical protein
MASIPNLESFPIEIESEMNTPLINTKNDDLSSEPDYYLIEKWWSIFAITELSIIFMNVNTFGSSIIHHYYKIFFLFHQNHELQRDINLSDSINYQYFLLLLYIF